ncbi:hypothetical protein [Pelotomaculum propionicicum]|uniref:hypothetical protein n=1 Tax=Pelotomaculum propionicicum TaxID=258475 RepID=UPI003BA19BB1
MEVTYVYDTYTKKSMVFESAAQLRREKNSAALAAHWSAEAGPTTCNLPRQVFAF